MNYASLRNPLAIAGTLLALAIAAPAEAARFTINIDDGGLCNGTWTTTGTATTPTITCMQGTTPPPTCDASPSPNIGAGEQVLLTLANCSPSTGLSYTWTQNGAVVSTSNTYQTPPLSTTTIYLATVTAGGQSTPYPITVTVRGTTTPPPPPPPVTTTSCSGYSVVNLGDLSFNGSRIATDGVTGNAVVVGRIVLPNPLPSGWAGDVASIAVFEYLDPQYSKKMYITQTPCDFSAAWPAYGEGNSMNVRTSFQNPMYNAVNMNPGDVWYLTVKNERSNGNPSCKQGSSCNFAVTLSAPSSD